MGTRANIWSMRVVHVALSIGLVIAALVAVRAQQAARVPRSAPATPLTAQDYLDIQALANRYAYGLDTGAENGTGSVYASVFAEDAEFHGPPAVRGGQPFDAAGREALRKFAVPGRGSAYVRHFMSNHLIEASPEGARGKVYLLVIDIGQDGKPTSVNMGGHYEDIYVRTAAGWRIKRRDFFRSKSAQTVQAEAAAAGQAPQRGALASSNPAATAAQARPAASSANARLQTLEDKEAIHALMMNYGRSLDARDFAGFAQLFARDAEFVGGTGTAKGPDAIRALLESLLKANAAPVSGRDFHLFFNETIEVTGDTATALSKGGFVVRGQNNRLEMSILANYHDQFVREDGRWKFKRRQIGDNPAPAARAQ